MKRNGFIGGQMLSLLALAILAATGASANSNTVSYQGVLRSAALVPVADGTYQMRFSIFSVDTDGVSVWGPETHTTVATRSGMFSVYLGSTVALNSVFADHAALWLQVEVDFGAGAGFEVYNPRVRLASVPYAQKALHADNATNAVNADTVGGVSAAGLATQMDSKVSAHDSDGDAHAALQTPPGVIMPYGGDAAPTGYLLCNGAEVSRSTYSALYSAIGDAFGAGDGSTTFNLPDMRGIFPKGAGITNRAAGKDANGNFYSATLGNYATDRFQRHQHTHNGPQQYDDYIGGSGTSARISTTRTTLSIVADGANGAPRTGTTTEPQSLALNFIIKY